VQGPPGQYSLCTFSDFSPAGRGMAIPMGMLLPDAALTMELRDSKKKTTARSLGVAGLRFKVSVKLEEVQSDPITPIV